MKTRGVAALFLFALVFLGSARAQIEPTENVLNAKKVTISEEMGTIAKAIQELAEQSKIPIADERKFGLNAKIKNPVTKATFWQALDRLATDAGASISLFHPNGPIALVDGKPPLVAPSHHGIFRTTIQRVAVEQNLATGNHQCRVWQECAWEPRFKPFFIEVKAYHAVFAPDAQEKSLSVDGKISRIALGDKHAFEVDWRMEAPARSSASIKSLSGEWRFIGPEKMLQVVFQNLPDALKKPQKYTSEGITVALKKLVAKGVTTWEADLDLDYPEGGPTFESFEAANWLQHNEIKLQHKTEKKQTLKASLFPNLLRFTSNTATIKYTFKVPTGAPKLDPADWKLVYTTPGRIVEVVVPFGFEEIPLP